MAASRLDLEARLRALRENKASAARPSPSPPSPPPPSLPSPAPPPQHQQLPPPQTILAQSPVMPPVVTVSLPPPPPSKPTNKRAMGSPPRPNFATFDDARVQKPAAPSPTRAAPRVDTNASSESYTVPAAAAPPPPVDMAKVLGPAYEQAVLVAQFAIDCERKRLIHTAIDNYIRAGQALVAIGRQQTAPHLQTTLKSKALALLQRAEGLEDWANRIIAENRASRAATTSSLRSTPSANEETLRAAIAQSQQQEEQDLSEKEALVTQIKSENDALLQKLNRFVVLAKVQTRFRRVISERRARKAALEQETQATAESQETQETQETQTENKPPPRAAAAAAVVGSKSASSSPREEQKRALVNELHARIGLPEVDHFKTFKPLGETADHDRRQLALEQELQDVRVEAEKLRSAVQQMEETMQQAASKSREQSIKLEKQKQDEVAKLQLELERVKSALDLERRSSGSGKRSSALLLDSDDDDDDDGQNASEDAVAFEDNDMIHKLRVSLLGLGYEEERLDTGEKGAETSQRRRSSSRDSSSTTGTGVARVSLDHSSPRHRSGSQSSSRRMGSWGFDRDDEDAEDDDDGLWV